MGWIQEWLSEATFVEIPVHPFLLPYPPLLSSPSHAVRGGDNGGEDDLRWTTLVAFHPGVTTVVARGVISDPNGGRFWCRPEKNQEKNTVPTPSYGLLFAVFLPYTRFLALVPNTVLSPPASGFAPVDIFYFFFKKSSNPAHKKHQGTSEITCALLHVHAGQEQNHHNLATVGLHLHVHAVG